MADQTDQLQQHIESKRNELGHNIDELEKKVKKAADWHTYFEEYPMTAIGVAFGGGILLAMLVGDRSRRSYRPTDEDRAWEASELRRPIRDQRVLGETREKFSETIDTVKGALIGLATSKVRDMLSDAMPGFREQYENAERSRDRGPAGRPSDQKPLTM